MQKLLEAFLRRQERLAVLQLKSFEEMVAFDALSDILRARALNRFKCVRRGMRLQL